MSTHKKIDIICIAAIFFALALTALIMNGKAFSITAVAGEGADSEDWDTSSATKITLSDNGSTIHGNGAYIYDGDVYIVYAGHYVLTGELTDGSVIVDADKDDKIWISLSGVTLYSDDDAAIRIEQADKVFLTLAEGTENAISSGTQYNEDSIASGVDGTIYSRDDLTINGTGVLVVNAAYNHGIVCNDNLVITGGNITINAVQDGIHANDSVCIRNSAISIFAGDDGITVSNDDETAFLYVESGSITIPACYEGLEAVDITITGGTSEIMPTDDGINASGNGSKSVIRIAGGDITIINPSGRDADGLDSNGSIYVEGGRVFVSVLGSGGNCALDYGSENGGECVVSGGTVIACGGSMMSEGFDADSPQGFLMYSTTAEAGTTIRLEDSLGRELLSEEIPCSFSSVVLSTPELKVGDVCTLVIGDVQEQITIDNSSASGFFSPAGMFGGGMSGVRGHGGDFRNRIDGFSSSEKPGLPGGMEPSEGMKPHDSMELPKGMEPPDNMEPPEGIEPSGNMEPSEGMESPNGMEPFGGIEPPGSMKPSEDTGPSGNIEPSNGAEPPNSIEPPNGAEPTNRADGQEMQEVSGRPFTPDAGQSRENGTHSLQRDWGQMSSREDISTSAISADTLVLLGISVLILLMGLIIAQKVKH